MFCVHILYLWLYEHYQANVFNKNHCSIYTKFDFLFFYFILYLFLHISLFFIAILKNMRNWAWFISSHFLCRNGINNWYICNLKQIIYTWTRERWSLNRFVLWWLWMVHIFKSNCWTFKKHNLCILKLSFGNWK